MITQQKNTPSFNSFFKQQDKAFRQHLGDTVVKMQLYKGMKGLVIVRIGTTLLKY